VKTDLGQRMAMRADASIIDAQAGGPEAGGPEVTRW
jgi:hypothetical protein